MLRNFTAHCPIDQEAYGRAIFDLAEVEQSTMRRVDLRDEPAVKRLRMGCATTKYVFTLCLSHCYRLTTESR
jgi:hypothetical protein